MASRSSSKVTFHVASTPSDEVRNMTGQTLACVLIQLEGWLDKTRVEIVALDCSHTSNNSVTIRFEIWQCERNLCGFNAHSIRIA